MPSPRTGFQGLVITFLGIFENAFQADVAAHGIVEVVEQQQSQQAGHATVAVRERVDAQEVEHRQRHQHQRVSQVLVQSGSIAPGQIGHGHRRQVGSDRLETQTRGAIRVTLDDVVIGGLPAPACLRHIAV